MHIHCPTGWSSKKLSYEYLGDYLFVLFDLHYNLVYFTHFHESSLNKTSTCEISIKMETKKNAKQVSIKKELECVNELWNWINTIFNTTNTINSPLLFVM